MEVTKWLKPSGTFAALESHAGKSRHHYLPPDFFGFTLPETMSLTRRRPPELSSIPIPTTEGLTEMPLKCLIEGNPVFAFEFSTEDWHQLRTKNRQKKHLALPCCDRGVVPKTSKLGTQFFAHARRDGCESSSETAEHLHAKSLVAKAVKLAGWEVDTEVTGRTPDGEAWVADVLATKGKATVAIEVQWSSQSIEQTKQRQIRYAASGVRGLWLLRHPNLVVDKATPTFRLRQTEENNDFTVMIPKLGSSSWICNHNKNEAGHWQQEISLTAFVVGVLRGALKFAPAIGMRMPVSVSTASVSCWRCKKDTAIVHGITFQADKVLPCHSTIYLNLDDIDDFENRIGLVQTLFPLEKMRKHGIGAIRDRYSRTAGASYLSNGCAHCDALQGRFFDHGSMYDAEITYEVEAELSKQLAEHLVEVDSSAFCWWFDVSASTTFTQS